MPAPLHFSSPRSAHGRPQLETQSLTFTVSPLSLLLLLLLLLQGGWAGSMADLEMQTDRQAEEKTLKEEAGPLWGEKELKELEERKAEATKKLALLDRFRWASQSGDGQQRLGLGG